MDDFIKERGLPFLAHLLRRLSDEFVAGFAKWNDEIGIVAPPRTHSTMQAIDDRGSLSVTEVAALIRQSHPLVITWIRQLRELGLLTTQVDPHDRRRTVLMLTPAGKADVRRQKEAYEVIESTFKQMMAEAGSDVFVSLWRMEESCRTIPFSERLRQEAEGNESLLPRPRQKGT